MHHGAASFLPGRGEWRAGSRNGHAVAVAWRDPRHPGFLRRALRAGGALPARPQPRSTTPELSDMTGLERIRSAMRGEEVDRIPWVPFVGCHAGALIGATATELLESEETMLKGMEEAVRRYTPDGIPVTFDLQIEAEVLGCELTWADDNPPAVSSHALSAGRALADLSVPRPDQGRIGLVLNVARRLRQAHPEIALYGLITGPFTLGLHLMGTDIFMQMFDDPDNVHSVLGFCRDVCLAMAGYYHDAGCDVVAVVDPMTSQIGPEQFVEWVSPYATEVFDSIRQRGCLSSFFVCGHAQQNIEAMCACRPDNISVDENIPLQFVRDVCTEKGVSFGGNMQLTTVLLLGKPLDAQKNAIACMDVGGTKAFILSPGCDLPFATPPENLEAVLEVVADPYKRDVVRAMARESEDALHLDMGDYGATDKVIVDIITLDSEACAPCQYMVDAVRKVAPEFEGIVEWREHKIKYRESLVLMTSLMVRNVPTICIDGQITFVSRIPPRDELIAAIQKRVNEKFRMKIAQKKGAIYILGPENEKSKELRERIELAILELGADLSVEQVADQDVIYSYGVAPIQTPAVVTAKYQLKSTRALPEVAAIKEWIKDIA
jgi:MtaA/CmuA family methyltransferase